jgi:hypothetical protein
MLRPVLLFLLLSVGGLQLRAQISITSTTPVTESFDGMGATTTLPANWKIQQNASPTYAGGTSTLSAQASSGTPTAGGTYNWGSTATERAAGVMTSGSVASPHSLMAFYTNGNASSINQLTVSYDVERYRRNSAAASVQFYYSTNGTTWTAVTAGDVAAASLPTGTSIYAFNPPNLTVNVASFSISLNIPSGGSIYLRWNLNTTGSNSQGIGIDNVSVTAAFGGCITPAEPVTDASALGFSNITCSQMDVSWTNGDGSNRIVIASATGPVAAVPADATTYTASSVFGSGFNITGSEYVVYDGTGSGFTLTGLSASTTYYFTIYEYNPGTTCPNYYTAGTPLTGSQSSISCPTTTCPEITSILVNSCGNSTNEGVDEYFTFSTGSSSVSINSISITFPAITPYCNSGCGAQTLVNNATYINTLNTTANCPGLVNYATTIPANSTVIVFTGLNPSYNYDLTNLCPGPIYAIFCNNTGTAGRFANNSGSNRTLSVSFGGSCNDAVTYFSSAATNTDGDFVSFDAAGTASYLNNGACLAGPLPIELLSFTATAEDRSVKLEWITASETNNDRFAIERTHNGAEYETIAVVDGAGTSPEMHSYSTRDNSPMKGQSYYRLKQTDFDGRSSYSSLVPVRMGDEGDASISYNGSSNTITVLSSLPNTVVDVIDVMGKIVYSRVMKEDSEKISMEQFGKGLYVVRINNGKQLISRKIICN